VPFLIQKYIIWKKTKQIEEIWVIIGVVMKRKIDYEKLLKEIDLNPYPECPEHLIRVDGTEGIICDREGLQYIVADPFVRAVEYLYDLNIRTESCGQNWKDEIGISCEYSTLSEKNKQIVDDYLKQKGLELTRPNPHSPNVRFRISVAVDMEHDTVASAEKKLAEEIKRLGLVRQDVLFGGKPKKQAIIETIDRYSERKMKWNGESFETVIVPTLTEQEALELLKEQGRVITEDEVWYSEELYHKHLDYIKEQKQKETDLIKE